MSTRRQTFLRAGFSLLEVLVTLVIISIGLLGVAAVQAFAIASTHTANTQSLLAMEAQSMASAMQANPAYWKAGLFPATAFTVTGATISDSTLNSMSATACSTNVCTPQQIAGSDLKNWGSNLQSQIPSAVGTISCSLGATTTTPATCQITITATEAAPIALNQGTASSSNTLTKTYTLINQL